MAALRSAHQQDLMEDLTSVKLTPTPLREASVSLQDFHSVFFYLPDEPHQLGAQPASQTHPVCS